MQFMLQYPDLHGNQGDMLDAGPVHELATAAERAGWHGFALTEHPAATSRWLEHGGHQTLDPFVALGAVAAVTERLQLLTYLAVVPYRNPLLLAKAATSVDRLSGGRFVLGVGTGYLKSEFRALGIDFDERNALFDEALEVLPLHWSGQPFSFEGRHFSARDVQALPRPARSPIPIWIGGNASITRRRVAERAQGWMPLIGPDEMYVTTRTPDPGSLEQIGARIKEIQAAAADRGEPIDLALPYLDPSIARPDVDVERHREALGRFEEIGATWVVVNRPTGSRSELLEFVEAFAGRYIRA